MKYRKVGKSGLKVRSKGLFTISKYSKKKYRFFYILFQYHYLITVAFIKYIIRGKLGIGSNIEYLIDLEYPQDSRHKLWLVIFAC